MTIKAGSTINVKFTLDKDVSLYKSIYAAIYTNDINPAFFYYGDKSGFFKITNGSASNKVTCTVPSSFSKTMSGTLMVELLLDRTLEDENITIGAKDTGVKIVRTVISKVV